MGLLPSIIWRALPAEPSVQRGWFLGGVWKVASVSEVSGDWEDAFIITSESDSESGSWGEFRLFLYTREIQRVWSLSQFSWVGTLW